MGHVDPINNMALDRTPDSFALSNRNLWDFIGCSSSKRNFSAPILWCYCSTWDFELMLTYFGGVKADNFSRIVSDQSYFLNIDMWIKKQNCLCSWAKIPFLHFVFLLYPKKTRQRPHQSPINETLFSFLLSQKKWHLENY